MPARNAPSAIDTPNTVAEPTAMPSAITSTVSVNSSRDFVVAILSRSLGISRAPTMAVKPTSANTLSAVTAIAIQIDWRLLTAEQRRQQHEGEHGEHVLHDQPANSDVSGRRVQHVVVRQDANHHHRAGDRQRHAEDDSRRPAPAHRHGQQRAQSRGHDAHGRRRRERRCRAPRAAPRYGTAVRRRTSAG